MHVGRQREGRLGMGAERALAAFKAYLYLGRRVLERGESTQNRSLTLPLASWETSTSSHPCFLFCKIKGSVVPSSKACYGAQTR